MKRNWDNEKENLTVLINNDTPYVSIGKMYGISGTAIKKIAKKIGIELKPKRKINPKEHFNRGVNRKKRYCLNCGKKLIKSQKKYCSIKCQNEYLNNVRIEEWKKNPKNYKSEHINPFIRNYMLNKVGYKCEKCGWGVKNPYTHKLPLHIHHMDGDCTNNKEENLQVLCPNCHSLTENFGSNNKESKRYKLKEYKTNISINSMIKKIVNMNKQKVDDIKSIIDNINT